MVNSFLIHQQNNAIDLMCLCIIKYEINARERERASEGKKQTIKQTTVYKQFYI